MYTQTARVGIVRACLRFIEDPQRPYYQRLGLAGTPLLLLYILSPIDMLPELILGPLGIADDTALLLSIFLLVRLAASFYREKRYNHAQTPHKQQRVVPKP